MTIHAVGFDYSGVVARIPGRPWKEVTAEIFGVTVEQLQSTYFRINHLLNEKVLEPAAFYRRLAEELGRPERYEAFMDYHGSQPAHVIDGEVLQLVDELRAAGYKTGLLSNNTAEGAAEIRRSELPAHFDAVVVSAEIGFSKPDPRAFQILAQRLGVDVTELVYTDDTARSLERAGEAGYHPILFTGAAALRQALVGLGLRLRVEPRTR